jgi:hypothetical protein
MAKVFLHSVALELNRNPWDAGAYHLLKASAIEDSFRAHQLTDDPNSADVILFAELGVHGLFAERVRNHPILRANREKTFLFDPSDYAIPLIPGIYASLSKNYEDRTRARTGFYLRTDENPYLELNRSEPVTYLASFVGSVESDPVRKEIAKIQRKDFLIKDTSAFALKMLQSPETEDKKTFWYDYAKAIGSGLFSLCPRGRGAGSVRLFESMRMGRCPVIISDDWVLPDRIDWQACALIVPEKDAPNLPGLLDKNSHRAQAMGTRAREQWEKYYSSPVRFHWLVESCLEMISLRIRRESISSKLAWRHVIFSLPALRRFLHSKRRLFREDRRLVL